MIGNQDEKTPDEYHLFNEELRRHRGMKELKAMLADYEAIYMNKDTLITVGGSFVDLKNMIEKIVEILDERS
jgi:hypothetical protein